MKDPKDILGEFLASEALSVTRRMDDSIKPQDFFNVRTTLQKFMKDTQPGAVIVFGAPDGGFLVLGKTEVKKILKQLDFMLPYMKGDDSEISEPV